MSNMKSGDEEDNTCVEHSAEDRINEMFASLGEEYGNKPKSIAQLMFNT